MALSPSAIKEVDAVLESISRKIWNLPDSFPRAGLHAMLEEVGLNIPSVWEDYCGAAVRAWTQILNDQGALGVTARASVHRASARFRHWPMQLAFHTDRSRTPVCQSVMARNMATLLLADLHPTGGPEIWSGNNISTSISSLIPIHLDEDGCPLKLQPFPDTTSILKKLTALWDNGILEWSQILGRDPNGRPYFLDDRELMWANPTLRFPITQKLAQSLKYLRALLSSTGWEDWCIKKLKLAGPEGIDPSIAPRWRTIFQSAWVTLPDKPTPLTLSRASRQPTIEEALRNVPPAPAQSTTGAGTRIALHFKKRRNKGSKHAQSSKRKQAPTTEPLRGSDAPGEKASIIKVLARTDPRKVKHNRRFTYVEEFLVQWGPENCTL
jgi:hypothetical protein